MTKETMTVHQALCEVKVMSKRIKDAIFSCEIIALTDKSSKKINGVSIEEFEKSAKASNDKINDLIKRYFALKSAINQYNASHSITIGDDTYTIAEAIWIRSYGLDEKRSYLTKLTLEYNDATLKMEEENGDKLTNRAERFVTSMYGSKDKIDNNEFVDAFEQYKQKNELILVDPVGVRSVIETLQKEIDDFESGADAAIQVSNATNTIDIEY